ncbi:MAG: hypothetical protein ACH346_06170 [Chthoniobacterales bacterium]
MEKQLLAQVVVEVSMERSLYMLYEPLLVTTSIKNFSGSPLLLADDNDAYRWFGFNIETSNGTPLPPNNLHYEMPPLSIAAGETRTSCINITSLYPISDVGSYRLRALVYIPEFHHYFSSPPLTIAIIEGRLLWKQVVRAYSFSRIENEKTPSLSTSSDSQRGELSKEKQASPLNGFVSGPLDHEERGMRTISLLSHRLPDHTALYLRIEDKASEIVFCTHCLGPYLPYKKPEILIDAKNHIHILQNETLGRFIYSHVDLDGKIIDRKKLITTKAKPSLVLTKRGIVTIVGGTLIDPNLS